MGQLHARLGLFLHAVPTLQANLLTVVSYEVRGFKVAQHLSTLIGLMVVAWPVRGWAFPINAARRTAWAAILAGAARLFEFVTACTRAGVLLTVTAGVYFGRVMSNRSRVRV